MTPNHFSQQLSQDEELVLRSFIDHNPIAYPADCEGLTKQQIAAALKSLKHLDLLKQSAPLSLTKKGKQKLKELTNTDDEPTET
jgi:hypothetical protein